MWKVIDDVAERRKKSVVVLTTHSMEEGEALCSKVAIQVDGQFNCFGSIQQVKSRYGTGYEVPVKFKPVTPEQRDVVVPVLTGMGFDLGQLADVLTSAKVEEVLTKGGEKDKLARAVFDG